MYLISVCALCTLCRVRVFSLPYQQRYSSSSQLMIDDYKLRTEEIETSLFWYCFFLLPPPPTEFPFLVFVFVVQQTTNEIWHRRVLYVVSIYLARAGTTTAALKMFGKVPSGEVQTENPPLCYRYLIRTLPPLGRKGFFIICAAEFIGSFRGVSSLRCDGCRLPMGYSGT